MSVSIAKDPDAILDYGFDWSDWLADGEVLSTSTWTVPAGITKDLESNSSTGSLVWLSGGTPGVSYDCVNHVVSSAAREDDRTLKIVVRER